MQWHKQRSRVKRSLPSIFAALSDIPTLRASPFPSLSQIAARCSLARSFARAMTYTELEFRKEIDVAS